MDIAYPWPAVAFGMRYLYAPQLLDNDPWNLGKPLPRQAWIMRLVASIASMGFVAITVQVYQALQDRSRTQFLLKPMRAQDVVLKMLGSLTEPDSVQFFPGISIGKTTSTKISVANIRC